VVSREGNTKAPTALKVDVNGIDRECYVGGKGKGPVFGETTKKLFNFLLVNSFGSSFGKSVERQ